jgi:hypothetical protein
LKKEIELIIRERSDLGANRKKPYIHKDIVWPVVPSEYKQFVAKRKRCKKVVKSKVTKTKRISKKRKR